MLIDEEDLEMEYILKLEVFNSFKDSGIIVEEEVEEETKVEEEEINNNNPIVTA